MKLLRAICVGLAGAAAMSVVMAMARMAGMPVRFEMWLGSWVTGEVGFPTWLLGLGLHLAVGAAAALGYALVFEKVAHRAGLREGLATSMFHAVIAGVALALLPMVHPLVPSELAAPGAFLSNMGTEGMLAFWLLHLLYGGIVGSTYGVVATENLPFAHEPRLGARHWNRLSMTPR